MTESSFHTIYVMYKVHAIGISPRFIFFLLLSRLAQDSIQGTAIADGR